MYSRGKNRNARYHSALGSARETLSCLEVAVVCRYVQKDAALYDQLDRVVGTLGETDTGLGSVVAAVCGNAAGARARSAPRAPRVLRAALALALHAPAPAPAPALRVASCRPRGYLQPVGPSGRSRQGR